MYVCMYSMYVCMYVCMYSMYVCMYVCMYEYICTRMYVNLQYRVQIKAYGPWPILCLFSAKGNGVFSFMQMRHSADLKCWQLVIWRTSYACPPACRGQAAGCLSGAARTAPSPYTTQYEHQIRKWIESERERATKNARDASLHEYMYRLSCETEQTKELVGRPASTQSIGWRLTQKAVICHSIYYARIMSPP